MLILPESLNDPELRKKLGLGFLTESATLIAMPRGKRSYIPSDSDVANLMQSDPNYYNLIGNYSESKVIANTGQQPAIDPDEQYGAAIVYGRTEFIVTNLKHFQEYGIEVRHNLLGLL